VCWIASGCRPRRVMPSSRISTEAWRSRTAVGTVAACGFGGVLYKVITSPAVLDLLKAVISRAFRLSF